ncbi:MAG TPA: hypothetical protein PKE57_10600, partial [Cellvibrionaceae bacterium]|nr:hypothetical protein [Cellvibrionaceae bacterium]
MYSHSKLAQRSWPKFSLLACYSLLSASFFCANLTHALTPSNSSSSSSSSSSGGAEDSSSGGVCEPQDLFIHDSSSQSVAGAIAEGDCSQPNDPQSLFDRFTFTLQQGQHIAFSYDIGVTPVHIKVLDSQGVTRGESSGGYASIPAKGTMLALEAGT